MPLYCFKCSRCGHEFEKIVKMDVNVQMCQKCHGCGEKIIAKSNFILKGKG